jgi:hypothetical protein
MTDLRTALEAITQEIERTIEQADRPKGGMQVPFFGDFANALLVPSLMGRFRWWAKYLRKALDENPVERDE